MEQELKLLGRDDILGTKDRIFDYVGCPEWGGKVRVRSLSAQENDEYEISIYENNLPAVEGEKPKERNVKAVLVALSVVDEKGRCLFTTADIKELGKKSNAPIVRIWRKVRQISGIGEGAVDRAEKNSETGQSGDSTSD